MTQNPVLSTIGAQNTHFSERTIIIICTLALQPLGSRFERRGEYAVHTSGNERLQTAFEGVHRNGDTPSTTTSHVIT